MPPYAGPPVASRQGDASSPLRLLAYLALAIVLIVLDDQAGWLARLRADRLNGRAAIRQGLDWLLANAAGDALPLVQFHDAGDEGLGPHVLAPLPADQARAALRRLLQLRSEGLRAPLLYGPSTGWALYTAAEAKRATEGYAKWHGSERSWAESSGASYQLALRGRDPFATADSYRQLLHTSFVVFTAVREGRVFPGFDEEGAAQ